MREGGLLNLGVICEGRKAFGSLLGRSLTCRFERGVEGRNSLKMSSWRQGLANIATIPEHCCARNRQRRTGPADSNTIRTVGILYIVTIPLYLHVHPTDDMGALECDVIHCTT